MRSPAPPRRTRTSARAQRSGTARHATPARPPRAFGGPAATAVVAARDAGGSAPRASGPGCRPSPDRRGHVAARLGGCRAAVLRRRRAPGRAESAGRRTTAGGWRDRTEGGLVVEDHQRRTRPYGSVRTAARAESALPATPTSARLAVRGSCDRRRRSRGAVSLGRRGDGLHLPPIGGSDGRGSRACSAAIPSPAGRLPEVRCRRGGRRRAIPPHPGATPIGGIPGGAARRRCRALGTLGAPSGSADVWGARGP